MQAVQTQPEWINDWIDKSQVAERLKISERTVLTLAGKIQAKKVRSPESNQMVWMFHAGDVERFAFDRDNPETGKNGQTGNLPVPSQLGNGAHGSQQALQRVPTQQMQPQSAAIQPQYPAAPSPRPWLTLDEAAEFSGLTKRWLRERADAMVDRIDFNDSGIRDMGKHAPGGRWRFHRESLEKL